MIVENDDMRHAFIIQAVLAIKRVSRLEEDLKHATENREKRLNLLTDEELGEVMRRINP